MRVRHLLATGSLAFALGAFPVVSQAVVLNPCVSSNTVHSQKRTARQMDAVRTDAINLRDHAAELQTFARNPFMSWESHAEQLSFIRHDVNDMGRRMCRLENAGTSAALSQAQSIMPLAADNTEAAINFLNSNHRNSLWLPTYRRYVDNLYQEADQVVKNLPRMHNGVLESSVRIRPSS